MSYNIWGSMRKRCYSLGITFMFLVLVFAPLPGAQSILNEKEIKEYQDNPGNIEYGWYHLPSFPNYAPNGLPDFYQKQSDWRNFCGPAAAANILWWFDSKHSNQSGIPGDGIDTYPLVRDYFSFGDPIPGPNYDDHNYNNVNDIETSWENYGSEGEFIERLAGYMNTNWYRFPKIPFVQIRGTGPIQFTLGLKLWIKNAGLEEYYTVESIIKPSFSLINERLRNNEGIILWLGYYMPFFPIPRFFSLLFGHCVAVEGINSEGYISLSDPFWDGSNPSSNPTEHNDAGIVSHDVYEVDFSSPYPDLSSWWIPDFQQYRNALVYRATIISENREVKAYLST
jgi:hypothetical protein